jgi:hypothetical protein
MSSALSLACLAAACSCGGEGKVADAIDTTPPAISAGAPSGVLPSGMTTATLSVATDETATCRYSGTAGTAYPAMSATFATTGAKVHSTAVNGLASGSAYAYYVRCQDAAGNASRVDFTIAFSVAAPSADTHTFVGAGDIASDANAEKTAKLLDAVVASDSSAVVFTTGDNAYPDGTLANFAAYYEPTWGRHRSRTRPVPGNHDYHVAGASDYLQYFCGTATSCAFPGGTKRLYYSYDIGNWHIIALNSEADTAVGSPQLQWLQSDLAAHPGSCLLAYWHKPLFSSGTTHGGSSSVRPFWDLLHAAKADVVLAGHEHHYERFAKQGPGAEADPNGIRQFVIGTGGAGTSGYVFGTPKPNSEVRYSSSAAWGIVKFTLRDAGYDWAFIPAAGTTFSDSGSEPCNK